MVGQQEAKLCSNSQEMRLGEKELAERMLEACLNGLKRAFGLGYNCDFEQRVTRNARTQR